MTSDVPGRARRDYSLAAAAFLELARQLDDDHWEQPGLGEWNVRDLVGHTSRSLITVEDYLDPTTTADQPELPDVVAYYQAAAPLLVDGSAVTERGRRAGAALGSNPVTTLVTLVDRVLALVDGSDDAALVSSPMGTMTLISYLDTRTFELVVHTLDLAAATDLKPPERLQQPLIGCLRTATDLAAANGQGAEVLLALTGRRPLRDGFSIL